LPSRESASDTANPEIEWGERREGERRERREEEGKDNPALQEMVLSNIP
jgi:hypothetical protein